VDLVERYRDLVAEVLRAALNLQGGRAERRGTLAAEWNL
jgi:hypothetical protein